MIKKIAESVMQPISYNRIAKILSSVAGKVTVPTISNYVRYAEDAWLILRLRNISSAFATRVIRKFSFAFNRPFSLYRFLLFCFQIAPGMSSIPSARRAYTRIECRCQILFSKKCIFFVTITFSLASLRMKESRLLTNNEEITPAHKTKWLF